MAAPTIPAASIVTIDNGGSTTGTASPTLSASGNNRILVIIYSGKDNSSTAAVPSAIVVDSAGVNATLANGKVVQQGSLQLAQEGNFSSTVDVYFVLEANLPSSAGTYVVDTTLDSSPQYHMWQIYEVIGCPAQAYDNIVQNISTANVNAGVAFSDSITPTVNDCLITDVWATSHSAAPTYTSTETQMATTSNTNGGSVTSQFTQTTAASKTMEQTSSTFHQRRAWTLLSFSGASGTTTSKTIVGSVTPVGVLTFSVIFSALVSGLISAVGGLNKLTLKLTVGILTNTGDIIKNVIKTFTGLINASGILATSIVLISSLTGLVTISGILNIGQDILKFISGSITVSGALTKIIVLVKTVTGSILVSGNLVKRILKNIVGSIINSGGISKFIFKLITGSVNSTGGINKKTFKVLVGNVTMAGLLLVAYIAGHFISGIIATVGVVSATFIVAAGPIITVARNVFYTMIGRR